MRNKELRIRFTAPSAARLCAAFWHPTGAGTEVRRYKSNTADFFFYYYHYYFFIKYFIDTTDYSEPAKR